MTTKSISYGAFSATGKTLDLSGAPGGFVKGRLVGVTNQKSGVIIYSPAIPGKGIASVVSGVVHFQFDTSGMDDADPLVVRYDDQSETTLGKAVAALSGVSNGGHVFTGSTFGVTNGTVANTPTTATFSPGAGSSHAWENSSCRTPPVFTVGAVYIGPDYTDGQANFGVIDPAKLTQGGVTGSDGNTGHYNGIVAINGAMYAVGTYTTQYNGTPPQIYSSSLKRGDRVQLWINTIAGTMDIMTPDKTVHAGMGAGVGGLVTTAANVFCGYYANSGPSPFAWQMTAGRPDGVADPDGYPGCVDLFASMAVNDNAALAVLQDIDTQFGTDGTSITPPTGGIGVRGWLSGAFAQLLLLVTSMGAKADSAATTLTGSFSVISFIKLFASKFLGDTAYAGGNTITVVDSATTPGSGSGQTWVTGAPTAGSFVEFAGLAAVQAMRAYLSGTWGGATVQVEYATFGGGVSDPYYPMTLHLSGPSANTTTFTANAEGIGILSGITNVRFRCTAAGSGPTVTVKLNTSRMPLLQRIYGTTAVTQVAGIVGSETSQAFTGTGQTFTIAAPADATRVQGARFMFSGTAGMTFAATVLMNSGATATLKLVNKGNMAISTSISTFSIFECEVPVNFSSITLTSSGSAQTATAYHAFLSYVPAFSPSSIIATAAGTAALADGTSNPTVAGFSAFGELFNGTSWDRARNNLNQTILASGTVSGTGTTFTADFTNFNAKGGKFFLNITAKSGTTPTLDVSLQEKDPASAAYADTPNAAFAQQNNSTASPIMLAVYPGVTAAANAAVSMAVGKTGRFKMTLAGTSPSFTYSIGVQWIN